MTTLSDLLDRAATAIENLSQLDSVADAAQRFTGAIPPGRVKDLLSGTDLGHPVHPLLVLLPIGAFGSAVVLDATGDPRAARRLIGVGLVSFLPAAITGASDWGDTGGAERRVGLVHAAVNWAGFASLAASWAARRRPGRGRPSALLGLSLLGASGWLGGHLAYALGVGVDTTAFSRPPADWTDVGSEADLSDGAPHGGDADGFPVLLALWDGDVRAIGDRCTHRGAPLDQGRLVGDGVECPWHGSRFRLCDGVVERGPATRPQPELEVRIADGRVQVRRFESRALRANPA